MMINEAIDRVTPLLSELALSKAAFLTTRGWTPHGLAFRRSVKPSDKSLLPPGDYLVVVGTDGSVRWIKLQEEWTKLQDGLGENHNQGLTPTRPLTTELIHSPSDDIESVVDAP